MKPLDDATALDKAHVIIRLLARDLTGPAAAEAMAIAKHLQDMSVRLANPAPRKETLQ